jgi:hypothetical protein
MKVDESNFETLQRAYDITGITNKIFWRDAENIDGYIDTDDVINLMDVLIDEYNYKRDELQDLENREKNEYEYDPYDLYLDHKEGIR